MKVGFLEPHRSTKMPHKCRNPINITCLGCAKSYCSTCYVEHVRLVHPGARYFLERISTSALITAKFNDTSEEEKLRSPEIQATSKGRIKCCGKFRTQNRHQRHCEVHHQGETQEQIIRHKGKRRLQADPITLLSHEQVQKLIEEIKKLQKSGEYYA